MWGPLVDGWGDWFVGFVEVADKLAWRKLFVDGHVRSVCIDFLHEFSN